MLGGRLGHAGVFQRAVLFQFRDEFDHPYSLVGLPSHVDKGQQFLDADENSEKLRFLSITSLNHSTGWYINQIASESFILTHKIRLD